MSDTQYSMRGFEETCVYVPNAATRSQAITEAREEYNDVLEGYTRSELTARKVWMRSIQGDEAKEFFYDEFESGSVECPKEYGEFWMWKVLPKQ